MHAFPDKPIIEEQNIEKPANEQYKPGRKMSKKAHRKSTSRGSRSRRDRENWMLNSRSVAKLMHIKQKIRGDNKANNAMKNEPAMIDDKPAIAVYDELQTQRLQSQTQLQRDLAMQQEAFQQRLAKRGRSRGTSSGMLHSQGLG